MFFSFLTYICAILCGEYARGGDFPRCIGIFLLHLRNYTLGGWLIIVTFAPETVNKSNTIKKN